jgi:hypothetical protein
MSWAIAQNTRGPEEKLVLLILASNSDADGSCRISTDDLADQCSMRVPNVRTSLDTLKATQLLTEQRHRGGTPPSYVPVHFQLRREGTDW